MNFLLQNDWLGREGPSYSFTWDHFLIIGLMMAFGIFLAIFLRKKSQRTIKITLIVLWAIGLAVTTFYHVLLYVLCAIQYEDYVFEIEKMLPLHSCLMFYYLFPVAMFVKNKYVKLAATNFLVIINMIMGFITLFVGCPGREHSALSLSGLQTLIYHGIVVIAPLIMVVTNFYDLKKWDIKYGLACFGILGLAIWIFDACTGCDYFYFYDGHTFPVFGFISENVHHLVWTLIVVSSYVITAFAIHFLIVLIKYLISQKEQNNNQ